MSNQTCARCGGRVPTIDNLQWTSFWGSVVRTETTTKTHEVKIFATYIRRPTSNPADDRILKSEDSQPLCSDCWCALGDWLQGRS